MGWHRSGQLRFVQQCRDLAAPGLLLDTILRSASRRWCTVPGVSAE